MGGDKMAVYSMADNQDKMLNYNKMRPPNVLKYRPQGRGHMRCLWEGTEILINRGFPY